MNKFILAGIFPVPRLFLGPDDGGGGGAPPAAPAADPNADILSFEMPDIGNVADIIEGKAPAHEPPPTPPITDPATPPTPPPTDPKAGDPPKPPGGTEPPINLLRNELAQTKAKLAEYEEKLKAGDPRITEFENKVKAKEQELQQRQTEIENLRKEMAYNDPEVQKPLIELNQKWQKTSEQFFDRVTALERGPKFEELAQEFYMLPRGTDGYRAARQAFEKKVNEVLGGQEDMEHRDLGKTLDFLASTREMMLESQQLQKSIKESVYQRQHEAQSSKYTARSAEVRAAIERAKTVPEDLKKNDPYHPKVVANAFASSLPPEVWGKITEGLEEYVELVTVGARPKPDSEYVGLTPQQIQESREREQARVRQAQELHPDVIYQGLVNTRLMPYLMQELMKYRERFGKEMDGAPPDPTKSGGGDPAPGSGDDLRDFKVDPNAIPNF